MKTKILFFVISALLFFAGYFMGMSRSNVVHAQAKAHAGVPKSYGHLVSAVVTEGGTGLVFEDSSGVIRFVTLTGQLESELTRN